MWQRAGRDAHLGVELVDDRGGRRPRGGGDQPLGEERPEVVNPILLEFLRG